ncbi:MAG: glutathione S-transferase family protein [Alphaproteobacteria bacterium]
MGRLVEGAWTSDDGASAVSSDGRYRRPDSIVRNWITTGGEPGPTGEGGFPAEPGRYHLYVAINCPWAHRTRIMRGLKKLEGLVGLVIAAPRRTEGGWVFDNHDPRYRDTVLGTDYLHQVYTRGLSGYTGRVTVPVLWDAERGTMVSNESSDIIRMFNTAFAHLAPETPDYYPSELRPEIDELNRTIYHNVNNGVYRAGFARTQEAYDEAVTGLFETLDALEERLDRRRYLTGDRLTEADWRLFPTLARFDVAYYGAFKCNLRRLVDYPNLWGYARELFQMPGIAETVDLEIYKRGYYSTSQLRNPFGIVPFGPEIDFSAAHGRDAKFG